MLEVGGWRGWEVMGCFFVEVLGEDGLGGEMEYNNS